VEKEKKIKKKEDNEDKNENANELEKKKNEEEEQLKIKKAKNESNEIFEGKLRDDINEVKGKKFNESTMKMSKKEESKKNQEKKIKIKFKKYCNAFNVSNNKLTTIEGIHTVLETLLPDLTFSSKLSKVQLIQWVDISRNKLTSIHKDICELPYLKILYVHGNNIQEIGKVTALGQCKSLTSLTLYGNPMDHIKGYRNFIIEMCPLLEKLDGAVISEKELDIIKFHGSRYGEVRDKKGNVKKYPKLPDEIIKTLQLAEQNNQEKKEDN
jgi:Leucine-rich repeat (LRR) protein